jgi:hypothetical protein
MSKPNVKKERTKNDVRYQDRTEITLGCVGKHDQGLFHFCGICLRRGSRLFFERAQSFPSDFNGMKKGLVRDKPQHFYYIIKSAFCKYVSGN